MLIIAVLGEAFKLVTRKQHNMLNKTGHSHVQQKNIYHKKKKWFISLNKVNVNAPLFVKALRIEW